MSQDIDTGAELVRILSPFNRDSAGSLTKVEISGSNIATGVELDSPTKDKHIIDVGGNILGSEYIRVSRNPKLASDEIVITSKKKFKMPAILSAGISISQRMLGYEQAIELVGCDSDGKITTTGAVAALTLPGSITVATANIIPIAFTNHGLISGQRVVLSGNTRKELNVGPTYVTVVDQNNFTLSGNITIATGTYSAGGILEVQDFVNYATDAFGYVYESASATNAQDIVKAGGSTPLYPGTGGRTWLTTLSTPLSTAPMVDAFQPAIEAKILASENFVQFGQIAPDSSGSHTIVPRSQIVPQPKYVKFRVRLKAHKNAGTIIGTITNIAKSGSAVATVTMAKSPSCPTLQVNDTVQIYGNRDITNFANTTTATAIASIVSQDTNTVVFTISFGASATTSNTDGGIVCLVNQGALHPVMNYSIQSIARSGGYVTATLNAAASGFVIGETVFIAGLSPAMASFEGWYKVCLQNVPVNTVVLKGLGDQSATQVNTNTGGAIYRSIDVRLHFWQVTEYNRQYIESIISGHTDANKALPVFVGNTVSISGTANVQGANAQGSTTLVNPIIHESRTTNRAVTGDSQMTRPITDKYGRQIVALNVRDLVIQEAMVTISTTTETTIAAAVAATFKDIHGLIITNTSATATRVDIRDTTAGAVRASFMAEAGKTQVINFDQPLKHTAVNTNWTAQLSVAATDVRITALVTQNI